MHGTPTPVENGSTRSYIAAVIKFCERPCNKHLVKSLGCKDVPTSSPAVLCIVQSQRRPSLRRDKYNPKIKKYYVEVEEEDEDLEAEEEKERQEEISQAGDLSCMYRQLGMEVLHVFFLKL